MSQVRILSFRPNKHRNCDTIRYHKSGAYFSFKKSWFSRLFCFLWARLSFSVLLCSSIITLFFYQNPPLSYSLKPYRHLTSKRKVSVLHHIKRAPKVVFDLGSFFLIYNIVFMCSAIFRTTGTTTLLPHCLYALSSETPLKT